MLFQSSQTSPPLQARQSNTPGQVTVGYGGGGGDPIKLTCGDVPDTGFFKLFVSRVYVDMEHIKQGAIEAASKRKLDRVADEHKFWGCSLAVVTVEHKEGRKEMCAGTSPIKERPGSAATCLAS